MATIAIDFDGVIHKYSRGWADGTIYDPPMPGARKACRQLIADGHRLILFTTRAREDGGQRQALTDWLDHYDFDLLFVDVTAVKPLCHLIVDDRAVRFRDWDQASVDIDIHLADEGLADPTGGPQ